MAAAGVDIVLLQELKNRFPEIPEEVVASFMKQLKNDRKKCLDTLERESPNYIFGNTPVIKSVQEFTIGSSEGRIRSDSASSGVSSTSSCSVSSVSSSPFSNPNHNSTGMHSSIPDNRPGIGSSSEFNQFINMPVRHPIPNIACDASNLPGNSINRQGGGSLPQNHVSSLSQGMRQIQIHRVAPAQNPPNPNQFNPHSQTIEIQISPRNSQPEVQRHNQYLPQPQYRTQMSYPGWNRQVTPYGGDSMHGYQSPENKQYVLARRPVPPVPTSQNQGHSADSHSNAPMSLPSNQHLSSPTNPRPPPKQHSSRATFFIQNSSSCGHISEEARDRTPISLPNDFSLPESHSEPNLSGQPNYPTTTAAQIGSNSIPQMNVHSHQQMNDNMAPLFVRMDPTDSNSVNSPNYNSYLPSDSGQASDSTSNTRYLNMNFDTDVNRLGGAVNPPSYIYPTSNFVTLDGTSHADNGEQMFINHPPVPNRCSVPGHPPVFARTSSGDSDRRSNLSSGDERHVSTHIVFPSVPSDSSSVSSESSKRLSSGSMQEEAAYTTALLQFQRDKMEKLKKDLENELRKLSKTRSEVNQMDKNMLERQRNRYSTFPSVEDVSRLREINRRLQTDIQVMTREIDMFENGQTPLGILDPLEQQNFYKNMNTGQHGSIYSRPPPQTPSRETPPPIPPRTPITSATVVPPAPPPQPQQDSDGDGEPWNCSACTFLNHPALNKCECCEMPRLNNSPPETGNPS